MYSCSVDLSNILTCGRNNKLSLWKKIAACSMNITAANKHESVIFYMARSVVGAGETLAAESAQDEIIQGASGLAGQVEAVRKAAKQAVRARAVKVHYANKTSKSERTRARILKAASELIVESGGTDFQMSEVADRCEMSKGALYYYFPDHDAIVEEIFSHAIDDFASKLEGAIASSCSAEEALRNLIETFGISVREGGLFVAAMASELVRGGSNVLPQLKKRFSRITRLVSVQVKRAKIEGLIREDVDPDVAAATICGAVLFGASKQLAQDRGALDVDTMTEELLRFIVHGIGAKCS
jgi:AcrR family transcriptional regulator